MQWKFIRVFSFWALIFFLFAPRFTPQTMSPPPIPQLENPWIPEREINAFYSDLEWLNRCSSEVDSRIQGKTASQVIMWRTDTEYRTDSWAHGLNLTAVTLVRGGPRGVAVTPRHILYTKHYGYHAQPGQAVKFLTMDNRIISRVVDQVKYLGSPNNTILDKDVAVVRLREDLPGSISPMKIIAPEALPDVAQQTCPVLRINQSNKALLVASYKYKSNQLSMGFLQPTANSSLPKIRPYAPYYEDMIMGDSSSPSILIYRDGFGVTPFLMNQVTYGGTGVGPSHTALASEIQSVILSFGDTASKYQLVFGPYEFSGHQTPTCSIFANRLGSTGTCSILVQGSGDFTLGNPTLSPNQVVTWSRTGNQWSGTAACSTYSNTTFVAQLSGPGGQGIGCESGEIKSIDSPPNPKPSCNLNVTRNESTGTCRYVITSTSPPGTITKVVHTLNGVKVYRKSFEWNNRMHPQRTFPNFVCAANRSFDFTAVIEGPGGQGSCRSPRVPAIPK